MYQKRREFLKGISLGGASLAMAPFVRSLQAQSAGIESALPEAVRLCGEIVRHR